MCFGDFCGRKVRRRCFKVRAQCWVVVAMDRHHACLGVTKCTLRLALLRSPQKHVSDDALGAQGQTLTADEAAFMETTSAGRARIAEALKTDISATRSMSMFNRHHSRCCSPIGISTSC